VNHEKFQEFRLTGRLPSPSAVGLRILALTKDEDYVQDELTDMIASDPALAARILKIANSGPKNSKGEAESIAQATMRLGPMAIRNIALGFTLVADNRTGACARFDYERYWAESLASAVAAQVIAEEKGLYEPSEAFTCALLCDVGKLAFASVCPAAYSEILAEDPATNRELAAIETGRFLINHRELTCGMMTDWGLPRVFQEAVLLHDFDSQAIDDDSGQIWALVMLLRAGKRIARLITTPIRTGDDGWRRDFLALGGVASSFGISLGELHVLCDQIQSAWREWSEAFGFPELASFAFAEVATELERRSAPLTSGSRTGRPSAAHGAAERADSMGVDRPSLTRILVIDDDERMLRLIEHHLGREEFAITTAQSSDEGLRTALEDKPQIIITDWMMPGMTGVKLCEALRQTEAGRKMYVLLVTSRENDDQVVEAFEAGADDYIVKPFNPRILLARVRAGQRMIHMREQVEESERVRLRQVAELGILTRKLRASAMTDALTELPNRRYAMSRLKAEWESTARTDRPLSVIMVDIDHFKRVNDQYGHDVGDHVLRETSKMLRSKTRGGDVLCRLGGEEFLSINIGCNRERARVCAERMRAAVELQQFKSEDGEWNITVSLGVAEWSPATMSSIDDLLKEADEALYRAKDAGRNRVVVATPRRYARRPAV